MSSDLPETTNINLTSPGEFVFVKTKFWDEDITNTDLINIYKRKGIAFRSLNKQTSLMFKNGWTSEDETALAISKNNKFDQYIKYAYLNALISGWSLIYKNYGDSADYSEPAPTNGKAIDYYVITRGWVFEDRYINQEVRDYYNVYRADSTTFKIHESRIIRVKFNPDGISKLLPAYNSIQVLDNVLWGMGQTMFRSGSGFPVLSINDSGSIVTLPDGTKKTRMQYYRSLGFLRDMNTQTGFMVDANDKLTFEGAQGKAISPGEYYDRAFQNCSVDLDVPVDILKGVAAGAVTGSETNLKEYYGDLNSKQHEQLEPIYNEMFESQRYYTEIEYKWKPIFQETKQEVAVNLEKDVQSIHEMELYGYYSHEQAVQYFAQNYPSLDYQEQEITQLANLPVYEKQQSFSFGSTNNKPPLTDQYEYDEESALPPSAQKIESKYDKEMLKAFKSTTDNVTKLLLAFNTD